MGVLVASAIGLIVIIGLTKLFVHMDSQISQLEQKAKRSNLTSLLGNYMNEPQHCKETLLQTKTQLSAGSDTDLYVIKVTGGGSVLDIPTEQNQLKSKYGIEGLVKFQLKCEETGGVNACKKCAGPFPCSPVKWALSLVSQSIVSGVPRFNSLVKIPLLITHTGANDSDFECNSSSSSPGLDLSNALCPAGKVLQGFDSSGNKVCLTSSACDGGSTWSSSQSKCVCPNNQSFIGDQCGCKGNIAFVDTNSNQCVCPSGQGMSNYSIHALEPCTCPNNKPQWNGTNCIPCALNTFRDGLYNRCKCHSSSMPLIRAGIVTGCASQHNSCSGVFGGTLIPSPPRCLLP
ncbi:MAG: hypothetical protein OXJ52_05170 [Oligoflexia bacterium]|nr:hypothetical protein [Oligoflexia bacterium]